MDAAANTFIPPSWTFYYDTLEREEINDVAVSQSFLLCTSRNSDRGYLNYFPLPTSFSSTTIANPLVRYELGYSVDDTILLNVYKSDDFFAATYSIDRGGITVNEFSGLYHNVSFALLGYSNLPPSLHLKDIKYNVFSDDLNVLQHYNFDTNDFGSVIWHVDRNLFSVGGPLKGVYYWMQIIQSIICLWNNPNHTLASGFDVDWCHVAELYQHKLNTLSSCERPISNICFPFEPNIRTVEYRFSGGKYEARYQITGWRKYMLPWEYKCILREQ